MEIISLLLSFLSIALATFGIFLAYISFFDPLRTLQFALANSKKWTRISGTEVFIDLYRHKRLSGFTIEVDSSEKVVDNFWEPWMKNLHMPDRDNNSSYYVRVRFNGTLVLSELFLSFDGGRNFVPVPRRQLNGDEVCLYIDKTQLELANIVGRLYFHESFHDFWKRIDEVSLKKQM